MLRNGVFGIPASLKDYLNGTYMLKTLEGITVGNFRVKENAGWSIGSFFRRRGAEIDDFLMILFDLKSRIARIAVGENEDILELFTIQDIDEQLSNL
jgi:hypothetical protein